jgi:AraC family transcriptional regulator
LEVALAIGFQSGEAFARAFKTRFGSTPSAWRRQPPRLRVARIEAVHTNVAQHDRNPGQAVRNPEQAPGERDVQHLRSDQFFAELNMKIKMVDFPATRVAYLRTVGPMGATVGVFWRETVMPWLTANGLAAEPRFGIALDNPAVTAPEKCRYDACVEVSDDFVVKSPAAIRVLPTGRYAVRSFKGNPATIGDAWAEVFRDWLPSSSMQMDSRPCIEYYPAKALLDMNTGAFECELWVPVVPL